MNKKLNIFKDMVQSKLSTFDYTSWAKDSASEASGWFAASNQDAILKWLNDIKFSKSDYDEAMDATYNSMKKGAGGGNHRLFDGGHSLGEAWDNAQDAFPDDTFAQEVVGYLKALWNDASTVKGLPFKTLEQADYKEWVDKITDAIPGISKDWLYDLTSFDALEITSTGIGAVSAIFMLNSEDKKRFSEILGSMSIASVMGANPIMGLIVIALTGYAYFVKKHEIDKAAFSKSATLTGLASILFSTLGLPFIIELLIVLVVSAVVRKKVLENPEIISIMKHHLLSASDKSKELLITGLKRMLDHLDDKEKKAG